MMRRKFIALSFCLSAVFCSLQMSSPLVFADDNRVAPEARDQNEDRRSAARRAATEKRREWLRQQLTAEIRDPRALAQVNAQLDGLDDQQVDLAVARLLEQLDKRRGQQNLSRAQAELARAKEVRDALRRRAAATRRAPAGFFPVITVLPQGASLTASAVVSPDRRHVRVNVNPFFSSIGPVDTFNFYTGETYRLPEYNPQLREPPPVSPRYDGFRTRNDPKPRR